MNRVTLTADDIARRVHLATAHLNGLRQLTSDEWAAEMLLLLAALREAEKREQRLPPIGADASFVDYGERCPNEWACEKSCPCHRLSEEERVADVAAHFRVKGYVWNEPVAALTQETAPEEETQCT